MGSISRPTAQLPPSVLAAIADLITQARLSDVLIVDVDAATKHMMESVPEAADLGSETVRTEIARAVSKEVGLGVSFPGAGGNASHIASGNT